MVSVKELKEQLTEFPYTDFLDSQKGYSPISSSKKLVAHFERMQSQRNIAEEKVSDGGVPVEGGGGGGGVVLLWYVVVPILYV